MRLDKFKIKAIRQLSERLPISYEIKKHGCLATGEELKNDKLEPKSFYKAFRNKFEQINHFNRIERAFKKYGEQGIVDYIYWVNNNNKKFNEKYEQLKLKQVSEDVLELANKGAKGFWQNLLGFLFAFLKVFGVKNAATNE